MKKKDNFYESFSYIAYFTYFGLSIISPVLLLSFLGYFLVQRFSWPGWVAVLFVVVGAISSVLSLVKMIRLFMKKTGGNIKKQNKDGDSSAEERNQ